VRLLLHPIGSLLAARLIIPQRENNRCALTIDVEVFRCLFLVLIVMHTYTYIKYTIRTNVFQTQPGGYIKGKNKRTVQYMICWIPNHSSSNTQVADSSSPYTGSSVQIRKSQIHLAPIPGQVFKYPSTDSSSSDTGSSGYMVSKYVGKDLFLLELDTPEKL